MSDLSDAFIAIPGGFGTLEELLEIITWNQIGLIVKPVGVLNVCGYFDHLLKFFDHAVHEVSCVDLLHQNKDLVHVILMPCPLILKLLQKPELLPIACMHQ